VKVAILGASGKTGINLVREALSRGHDVVAICRDTSAAKLNEFTGRDKFTVVTPQLVSDRETLLRGLVDCDAVVALLIAVRQLKATDLVKSLAHATSTNGVKRLVFTAGEITAVRDPGEACTLRQHLMLAFYTPLGWLAGYSLTDMRRASVSVKAQPEWEWTIIRAPTLRDTPAVGYRFCKLDDITAAHALSRQDYAACLLDSIGMADHYRRSLAVVAAGAT
jgi:putative NADH-flavin reductase